MGASWLPRLIAVGCRPSIVQERRRLQLGWPFHSPGDFVYQGPTAHHGYMREIMRDGTSPAAIAEAVAKLRAGGLVAIPTETVYGLAADASSSEAVGRIFEVKGRPRDHPLILHIHAGADLERWSVDIPDYGRELARRFWPGPLTLVLPRSGAVGGFVTGGQPTVAVRAPDHPVAQDLLRGFGGAVAAPSANVFGAVSPTRAEHVLTDLGPRLDPGSDLILDGGPCSVGLESTILDCTGPAPRVLRPGGLGPEQISEVAPVLDAQELPAERVRVPGSLESHYSPEARVVLTDVGPPPPQVDELRRIASRSCDPDAQVGLIAPSTVTTPAGWNRLLASEDSSQYARELYKALRSADESRLDLVVAVLPAVHVDPETVRVDFNRSQADLDSSLARAIADRLRRAAS